MHKMYKRGTKARFSFSGGSHAPAIMADSMEEVNVYGEKSRKCHICSAVLCYISYVHKSFKFLGTSIFSLDPETVHLHV